jgi:hypothetical protein
MPKGYAFGDDGTTFYKIAVQNYLRRVTLNGGESATFPIGGNYGAVLVMGLAQGIGGVCIAVGISNGNLTLRDLLTGATFSSSYLTFSFDSSSYELRITNNMTAFDRFTVIIGSQQNI